MKRKLFLDTFLGALGAIKINWGKESFDRIYGTVIYNETDPDEQQDFVWYMTEQSTIRRRQKSDSLYQRK